MHKSVWVVVHYSGSTDGKQGTPENTLCIHDVFATEELASSYINSQDNKLGEWYTGKRKLITKRGRKKVKVIELLSKVVYSSPSEAATVTGRSLAYVMRHLRITSMHDNYDFEVNPRCTIVHKDGKIITKLFKYSKGKLAQQVLFAYYEVIK